MRRSLRWTAAVLTLMLAGCAEQPTELAETEGVETGGVGDDGSKSSGPPRVTVLLKDAPGDVVEAVVTISRVYLQGDGRVTLRDEPVTTDLTELANSALTLVDGEEVPPGAYSQLRFVITGGYIAVEQSGGGLRYFASSPNFEGLPDGVTATGKLHMPSFAQSGLKVKLPDGFEVDGSEVILVDFDVSQSFGHKAGKSGRWIMHPVITASELTETGSITVDVALADTVTLPAGVTLADFSARLERADGGTTTIALEDVDGDGTFSATFNMLDPANGPFDASIVGPAGLAFTTDPVGPVEVALASGESATVSFTITSAATASITVNAVLADDVTLPEGVTLANFSAQFEEADGDQTTIALADPDVDGTFSATFNMLDPAGSPFQVTLVGPTDVTFTTDPAAPVEVTLAAGDAATVSFTITSAAGSGG